VQIFLIFLNFSLLKKISFSYKNVIHNYNTLVFYIKIDVILNAVVNELDRRDG
jgi:hypothetical protein